jgi:phospholipid/cholesterol/gamma-HCH transport system substrate-binding protein
MKIRKEFIIGIVAVLTLFAAYWGLSFLKGNNLFAKEKEFVLVYDRVVGLTLSNPVIINGLRVGKVSYVDFIENDSRARVLVKIKLDKEIAIPRNSQAVIKSDFLGVNSIDLMLGKSTKMAQSGDTLGTGVATTIQEEVSMQVLPLKVKAEEMMASIDAILISLRMVFNDETVTGLGETFRRIKATIKNLESSTKGLDDIISNESRHISRILANFDSIAANLNSNNDNINTVLTNFSDLSDSLVKLDIKSTVDKMDNALIGFNTIVNKINNGEGTMGQLVNNDSLYIELEAASKELHELLEDIKLNPKRYVRVSVFGGKNNDEYVKPEKKK